jgi:hypothetical protein
MSLPEGFGFAFIEMFQNNLDVERCKHFDFWDTQVSHKTYKRGTVLIIVIVMDSRCESLLLFLSLQSLCDGIVVVMILL